MMTTNINTYSDAGYTANFTCVTDAAVAINLTGMSLRMHVRTDASDATVWLALSTLDGDASNIVITNAVSGLITITIPYAKLLLLPPRSYVHSLVSTFITSGVRSDIWRGSLTHTAGPTRFGSS